METVRGGRLAGAATPSVARSMAALRSQLDVRFLLGAFAAVAVTFFAANLFTQRTIGHIDAASDEIAFNAAPSIQHLASLRSAVRQVEFLLGATVALGDAEARASVEPALAQLDGAANAYLTLPAFPGERPLWRELNESLIAFHGTVQRTLAQLDGGAVHAARASLPATAAAADRISEAAGRALELNAQAGRDLALRIKRIRREAAWIGYALNASCAAFAILAGLLVRRQLRRYGALLEEHAALQESRLRELDMFAARAAHDILNPVSATQLSLALAAKRDLPDPRARELIERALRNLLRIRTIVDGLLQFARAGAQPSSGAWADVPDVLRDVIAGIRPLAEGADIEVASEEAPRCRVRCSTGVLTSIVSNLAQNAIKYMGESAARRITLRASERAGLVRIEVEDTGPGIPPDALDGIFLPYVRGPVQDKEGLGLGLATVKRLSEAHGGRVGVRSVVGVGSVFWCELPRSSDGASHGVSEPQLGSA